MCSNLCCGRTPRTPKRISHQINLIGSGKRSPLNRELSSSLLKSVNCRHGRSCAALVAKEFDDIGNSLRGATATSTAEEILAHRTDWNFMSWASDLTRRPLLVIGASKGEGEENRRLAEAVTRAGGKVTAVTLPSDHGFQDHRFALAAEVINWLLKLPEN